MYRLSASIENSHPKNGDNTAATPLTNAGKNRYSLAFISLLSNKASKTNGIKGVNKKPTALLARLSTRHSVPPSPATIVPTSA